jgi:hypothetical protein
MCSTHQVNMKFLYDNVFEKIKKHNSDLHIKFGFFNLH